MTSSRLRHAVVVRDDGREFVAEFECRREVKCVQRAQDRRIEMPRRFECCGAHGQHRNRIEHGSCLHDTIDRGASYRAEQFCASEVAGHQAYPIIGMDPRRQGRRLRLRDDEFDERRRIRVMEHPSVPFGIPHRCQLGREVRAGQRRRQLADVTPSGADAIGGDESLHR